MHPPTGENLNPVGFTESPTEIPEMASLAGLYRFRHISVQPHHSIPKLLLHPSLRTQWFSTSTDSDFSAHHNAYDLLGVPETSSFAEIKASFRKLAKQTHPDLAHSRNESQRFVQILAAYEILSDSEKRSLYDMHLLSQRKLIKKHNTQGSTLYTYNAHISTVKQMEVVEWLKWYRFAMNDILSEKKVVDGSGYFDRIENDFYSAIHAAYFGPSIESMDFLPDRFEAEERSSPETPEVLHLVSGRDLFGMVCLVNKTPELSFAGNRKLTSFASVDSDMCQSTESSSTRLISVLVEDGENTLHQARNTIHHTSDAYKDLELHVFGRLVAVASRVPPKSSHQDMQNEDDQDHIHVFLCEDPMHVNRGFSKGGETVRSRVPLGTITGMRTSSEEGSSFVYNIGGTKTHVIMKHRTLLVKHMHWYCTGDKISICECRCTRAQLPPSKFWLFEPRCGMHDIGGWYVETYGRDKKGLNVPSQRCWDGFDSNEQIDKRLHPAMYLFGLAYRTLDLEDARKRKALRDLIEEQLLRFLSWCKKLV